jgi:N-glycosylase/DNA lyase
MRKEKLIQNSNNLLDTLIENYQKQKQYIKQRLNEFQKVTEDDYFYEMCFCICTPQSSARNALEVVDKLKKKRFFEMDFDILSILRSKEHYIRFHNTKSIRLMLLKEVYPEVLKILKSNLSDKNKRISIVKIVSGFGMKESSHFMRNIGYRNLAILDRHILKNLKQLNIFENIPKLGTTQLYLDAEKKFQNFASKINIPMDELDLLFWSMETSEILK